MIEVLPSGSPFEKDDDEDGFDSVDTLDDMEGPEEAEFGAGRACALVDAPRPCREPGIYQPGRFEPGGADMFRGLIERVGEDPRREGLIKTPERAWKAFEFMTEGYRQDVGTVLNNAVFHEDYDDLVLVRDIEFYSLCEHHLLPFMGKAHVAYLPDGKVIGLSKIARLVNMFSRRLQVQERLTQEVGKALEEAIAPAGVAVVMEAQHMCMMLRGVQKQSSRMVTSYLGGRFREDARTRGELMDLLQTRG